MLCVNWWRLTIFNVKKIHNVNYVYLFTFRMDPQAFRHFLDPEPSSSAADMRRSSRERVVLDYSEEPRRKVPRVKKEEAKDEAKKLNRGKRILKVLEECEQQSVLVKKTSKPNLEASQCRNLIKPEDLVASSRYALGYTDLLNLICWLPNSVRKGLGLVTKRDRDLQDESNPTIHSTTSTCVIQVKIPLILMLKAGSFFNIT